MSFQSTTAINGTPSLPHPHSSNDDGRSLAGVSARAYSLGVITGISALLSLDLLLVHSSNPFWRPSFFTFSLALFHWLEFQSTATANPAKATTSTFLLSENGATYRLAHTLALLECVLHSILGFGVGEGRWWYTLFGLTLLASGQAIRTAAMLHAGTNFNHTIQVRKRRDHELVTSGVYSWSRHPSYLGFWLWGLGTQIVCGNVICLVGYAVVLWRFFRSRIEREEGLLVEFFGEEYVAYRKRTKVWIPFIN